MSASTTPRHRRADEVRWKPIIMSARSVRQILAGVKTETRRAVRWPRRWGEPEYHGGGLYTDEDERTAQDWAELSAPSMYGWSGVSNAATGDPFSVADLACPFGHRGDRLWVRENWEYSPFGHVVYVADGHSRPGPFPRVGKAPRVGTHPSMFMPRWASRIDLEITSTALQRVQDIDTAGLEAEGMRHTIDYGPILYQEFAWLWDGLNAKRDHPWATNPWVWVVRFKLLSPPPTAAPRG